MYSEMHILHEDFASIKLLIFQQKEVFFKTNANIKKIELKGMQHK